MESLTKSEIVVIGLGTGGHEAISLGAMRALSALSLENRPLFVRTYRHPNIDWLQSEEGIEFDASFDALYERCASFDEVYSQIVECLIAEAKRVGKIGYAVPGHPSFGERTVELLVVEAERSDIAIEIIGSQSYFDAVLSGEPTHNCPIRIIDALDIIAGVSHFKAEQDLFSPTSLHVIYQVYDRQIASELKITLLTSFSPDTEIVVVTAAGVPGHERRVSRPLAQLDHQGLEFNHLTTLLIRPLQNPEQVLGYESLLGIMARLRDPEKGCPWDREQTPQTLRRYLVEETYEVLDAIDGDDPEKYAEELGDLLLQVVFHAQLARERGDFTMQAVISAIVTKLVRRHPHVFGDVEAHSSDAVLRNWEAIKRTEKGYEDRKTILDGIPREMPSLLRAQEISKRASRAGFEWDSIDGVFAKLDEEVGEFRAAISQSKTTEIESELGDILFTVVNLARFCNINAEDALSRMLVRFKRRFQQIEDQAANRGLRVEQLGLAEMERIWQRAKIESV